MQRRLLEPTVLFNIPEMGIALVILVGCVALMVKLMLSLPILRSVGPGWGLVLIVVGSAVLFHLVVGCLHFSILAWHKAKGTKPPEG